MRQPGWTLDDLPIPDDVQPGPGWSAQMLEMADHIGAYATLLIVEKWGGQDLYIAKSGDAYGLDDLIGKEKADKVRWAYTNNRIAIPTAKDLLNRIRRAPIIAMARNGTITVSDAARRCRTSRTYMSSLVNQTDEGIGAEPPALPARKVDPRQIDMFDTRSPAPVCSRTG